MATETLGRSVWNPRACARIRYGIVICLSMISISIAGELSAQRVSPDAESIQKKQERKNTPTQTRVTVNAKSWTIDSIVREVARQAQFRLVFSDGATLPQTRVSLHVTDHDPIQVFTTVLSGTSLTAVLAADGETVVIRKSGKPMVNEGRSERDSTGSISGQVVDSASGTGVAGVSIAVQGRNISTVTDPQGRFTLSGVPVGDQTVTFRLLGYTSVTRSVEINGQQDTKIHIVLRQSARMLSGVVTTATGEQKALEVGHTAVSINVDSLQKVAPITSVTDILESRVPGMRIQRTSGTPGDPARIRIRGAGSIDQNSDPIIVVDGIRMYSQQSDERNVNQVSGGTPRTYATPSPLDLIDPNMIEKIEVLKGPSASAMYGTDAGNGVIVITTKRGRPGPPRWGATIDLGTSTLPSRWPSGMYKWVTPLIGGGPTLCEGFCGDARVDSIVFFQALNNPYLTALGRGSIFKTSTNVSGGNQTIEYTIGITSGRERGVLKLPKIEEDRYQKFHDERAPGWMRRPDLLERRGAQGGVRIQLADQVAINASSILNQTVQRRTSMSNSRATAIASLQRIWVDLSQLSERPLLGNPYERVTANILSLQNTVQLTMRPFSWFPVLSGQIGSNTTIDNSEMRIDRDLLTGIEANGALRANTRTSSGLSASLNSSVPAGDRLTVAAGANYNQIRTHDQKGALFGFATGVTDPSEGEDETRTTFTRNTSENVSTGWWLEPRLRFRSRFFATPGFRLDNNGLSGRNAKFNGLPRLNFSWLMSDEGFFPLKNHIEILRLRTAFGVSGEQPTQDQLHRLYQSVVINPLDGQESLYGDMLQLTTLGNTRLRPERIQEIEGGFDIELWRSRLNLQVTYWRKRRFDAIVSNQIAASIDGGRNNLKMNVGDLEDSGTEITAFAQLIERQSFAFRMNINFDRSQSLVRQLNATGDWAVMAGGLSGGGDLRYVVGYPTSGIWQLPVVGYSDLDGNGWIKSSELALGSEPVYVGSTQPAYQLGVFPGMNLLNGRISVDAAFSYVSGQLQTRLGGAFGGASVGLVDPSVGSIVQGPNGFDRQVAFLGSSGAKGYALYTGIGYSQKVNVTRWQSVSVTMNVNPAWVQWLKARRATISVQGQNLGVWTNYIGVDPNVNSVLTGHGLQDSGQQPEPRVWTLRLSLGN